MTNPLNYKITDLNKLNPKKSRLLIAEPFMDDPYFKRSVVLLTEFNKSGAFGFMLNKRLEQTINDIVNDFPPFDAPIFLGGPVSPDNLFYIHTQGEFIEKSIKIKDGLYWSGDFEQLKELIKNQQIFPNEIKFFIGYSGWNYEQLSEEIKSESWIISELEADNIAQLNDERLWHNTLQKMGNKFSVLSNFPEDPSFN